MPSHSHFMVSSAIQWSKPLQLSQYKMYFKLIIGANLAKVAVQMADACREADKVKLIIKLKSNSNRAFQDIIYKKIIIDTRIYTQTQVAQ